MILCDTNIWINYFNNHPPTIKAFDLAGRESLVIPAVSVMELYRGMRNKPELADMRKKLIYYDVVHINSEASEMAVLLMQQFKLSQNLQLPDALIGATAIIADLPLFTYNIKDFAFMPGVRLHQASNP